MGCGQSNVDDGAPTKARGLGGSESDNPTAQYPGRSNDAPKSGGGTGPGKEGSSSKYRNNSDDNGGKSGESGEGDDDAVRGASRKANGGKSGDKNNNAVGGSDGEVDNTVGPLRQSMLVDLRTKAAKEGGSSVQRWVDSITEPEQEKDSVDVFDPLRRHFISMDSLHQKGELDDMV